MAAADAHIAGLINDVDPGAFVTKYVVVAEVIDNNGERGVWMAANEDATQWDTYGLLTYALNHEAAHAEYDDE